MDVWIILVSTRFNLTLGSPVWVVLLPAPSITVLSRPPSSHVCQLLLLIWGIINRWDLALLVMSSSGPCWDAEVSQGMIKGLYLNNSIVCLTPKLAPQVRLQCFWRKSAFTSLAVATCTIPRVWTSVGGNKKISVCDLEEIRQFTKDVTAAVCFLFCLLILLFLSRGILFANVQIGGKFLTGSSSTDK